MNKKQKSDAELLEQIKANVKPLFNGSENFDIDPDTFIFYLEDRWLPAIERGSAGFQDRSYNLIPWLEFEAIKRIHHSKKEVSLFAKDFSSEEHWRLTWVKYACLLRSSENDEKTARSIEILITAQKLRNAISSNEPEKASALGMLIICKVMAAGFSLEFEAAQNSIADLKNKPVERARLGGKARADKYLSLEEETIRLYKERSWDTIGAAALEILPKIIKFGRENNLQVLSMTSKKPFEWISSYRKTEET